MLAPDYATNSSVQIMVCIQNEIKKQIGHSHACQPGVDNGQFINILVKDQFEPIFTAKCYMSLLNINSLYRH